jgi:c-di-GMP-binding flagellar brake protein YcgR
MFGFGKGSQKRQDVRLDVRIPVWVDNEPAARAWVHHAKRNMPTQLQPRPDELRGAKKEIRNQERTKVNLSAGGISITNPPGRQDWAKYDVAGILMGLETQSKFPDIIIYYPAEVVRVDNNIEGQQVAFKFTRTNPTIQNLLMKFLHKQDREKRKSKG